MMQYIPYGVKFSENQIQKLQKAYDKNCPISLKLDKNSLKGNDELMLTKTQINRIRKARNMASGVQINITKSPIRKIAKEAGSLWSSIAGMASKLLPMAMPLVKKSSSSSCNRSLKWISKPWY